MSHGKKREGGDRFAMDIRIDLRNTKGTRRCDNF